MGTEAECRSAATALGYTYSHSGNWPGDPKGCFVYNGNGNVYFNTHATGGTNPGDTPICATGTTSSAIQTISVSFSTVQYGTGPNGRLVTGDETTVAIDTSSLSANAQLVSVEWSLTNIEQTGGFFWDDLALSLSNPPQTAEISWGGYTANMRLDNYQGTLGALAGDASAGSTKDSGTVNITGGTTFCVSPNNMFVTLRHAYDDPSVTMTLSGVMTLIFNTTASCSASTSGYDCATCGTRTIAPTNTLEPTNTPTNAPTEAGVLGTQGTDQCPAGSISMGTEAECRLAATALGYGFGSSGNWVGDLKGCFLYTNRKVYFNTHETGGTNPDETPICADAAGLLGTQGTNVCPAGSVSMGTEAECRSAATALGYGFDSSGSWPGDPKGCFYYTNGYTDGNVYFNTHETGGTNPRDTPICDSTGTGNGTGTGTGTTSSCMAAVGQCVATADQCMAAVDQCVAAVDQCVSCDQRECSCLQLQIAVNCYNAVNKMYCSGAGSVSMGTEAQCTSAATVLGYTYTQSGNWETQPKGCFVFTGNGKVYFNTHETGGTNPGTTPICGTDDTGTEAQCTSAVTALSALGYTGPWHTASWETQPKGCFVYTGNGKVYFNTHETGGTNPGTTPISTNAGLGTQGANECP